MSSWIREAVKTVGTMGEESSSTFTPELRKGDAVRVGAYTFTKMSVREDEPTNQKPMGFGMFAVSYRGAPIWMVPSPDVKRPNYESDVAPDEGGPLILSQDRPGGPWAFDDLSGKDEREFSSAEDAADDARELTVANMNAWIARLMQQANDLTQHINKLR